MMQLMSTILASSYITTVFLLWNYIQVCLSAWCESICRIIDHVVGILSLL